MALTINLERAQSPAFDSEAADRRIAFENFPALSWIAALRYLSICSIPQTTLKLV